MDGRFVAWMLPMEVKDPSLEWEVLYRDALAVVKNEAGEGMGSDAGDRACRVVWGSVDGKDVLLLPGKTDVQYRCGEELKKQKFLMEGGHKDTVVTMAWEPSGKRFVTGGRDGKVFLWEMNVEEGEVTGSLIKELQIKKGECAGIPPVTSIVWEGQKSIRVADASGAVCVVTVSGQTSNETSKAAASSLTATDMTEEVDDLSELKTQAKEQLEKAPAKESGLRRLNKKVSEDSFDDDDDDAMFNEVADQMENQAKEMTRNKFIEDEAEDASDDDDATADLPASKVSSPAKEATNYEDFGTQPEPQDEAEPEEDMFPSHDDHMDDDAVDYTAQQMTSSFPPLQPAFAPSSTPINEARRILCWNHIGVVTSYPDPDSQYNLIDVAFHETAGLVGGRRPINFTDNLGFIVGTLGEEGALFASDLIEEEEEDDELDDDFHNLGVMSEAARKAVKASRRKKKRQDSAKGSQVYFNRFETFGRNADKDWVVALPDGERVLGCATGNGWCGVITRCVEESTAMLVLSLDC
jgi:chromosome transmission fidelity protein 4